MPDERVGLVMGDTRSPWPPPPSQNGVSRLAWAASTYARVRVLPQQRNPRSGRSGWEWLTTTEEFNKLDRISTIPDRWLQRKRGGEAWANRLRLSEARNLSK